MAQAVRYALHGPFGKIGGEKAGSGNSKGISHGPTKYSKHGTFSSNLVGMQQSSRTSADPEDAPLRKSRRAATLTVLGVPAENIVSQNATLQMPRSKCHAKCLTLGLGCKGSFNTDPYKMFLSYTFSEERN